MTDQITNITASGPHSLLTPSATHSPERDKIRIWSMSFFRSNLFKYMATVGLFTAAIIALPYIGLAAGVVIPAYILTALGVTVAAGSLVGAIKMKHLLVFDISLIYTALTQHGDRKWWNEISKDVVLGALPLEKDVPVLKNEGITHVITLLNDFELEKGLFTPATTPLWEQKGIHHMHEKVDDFKGVPVETIKRIMKHMTTVRAENPNAKFYIHCKAGRGRSAAIAVVDQVCQALSHHMIQRLVHGTPSLQREGVLALVQEKIAFVKEKRSQINLSSDQQATLIEACWQMAEEMHTLPLHQFTDAQLHTLADTIKEPGNPPSFSQLFSLTVQPSPDKAAIRALLPQLLPLPSLNYFYRHIWMAAGRPEIGDDSWGENHVLDDLDVFRTALSSFLAEKVESHPRHHDYLDILLRLSPPFIQPLHAYIAFDLINNPRLH